MAPPDPRALAPAVDLELAGNCRSRPPASDLQAELRTFLEIVEVAWGRPALLYVGDDWDSRHAVRATLDRPLWQLRFLRRPDQDRWRVWKIHGCPVVSYLVVGALCKDDASRQGRSE